LFPFTEGQTTNKRNGIKEERETRNKKTGNKTKEKANPWEEKKFG